MKLLFPILCLEGAILSFNVGCMSVLVPIIANDFKIDQFLAGKIIWFYMLPYGVAALIYGGLTRFFDIRRIELICFLIFSLSNLWAGLSRNIGELFVARLFMGLFGASVIPFALILIAKNKIYSQRGKLVGMFFSSTFIFSLVGIFLSGILPWRLIFIIPGLLGLLLWLVMYFYFPSNPNLVIKDSACLGKIKEGYLRIFQEKYSRNIFLYIFIISLMYHGIHQWLGVYFSLQFNLDKFLISILIILSSLSGIFGESLGGWFADILGRSKTINLGLIFMIVTLIILILKPSFFWLSLAMIIWGLGWTINHAGLSTLLTDLPDDYLYEAVGLNSSIRFFSGGLGVYLIGLVLQKDFIMGFYIMITILGILFFLKKLIREEVKWTV